MVITALFLLIYTLFLSLTVATNDYLIPPQVPFRDHKLTQNSYDFVSLPLIHLSISINYVRISSGITTINKNLGFAAYLPPRNLSISATAQTT